MTEKRFWSEYYSVGYYTDIVDNEKELKDIPNPKKNLTIEEVIDTLNKLNDENRFLKEKEKDMLDYLKKEYDYVYKQRMKHLDNAILVRCYELIRYHIRSMIEHLERL